MSSPNAFSRDQFPSLKICFCQAQVVPQSGPSYWTWYGRNLMAHEIKVSRKEKDYWMVSSGFKCLNLQKVGNSYPPSWCFSWYLLITGLGSTNISSKKLLKHRWHLVITSLQSLLIRVCTGAGNPARGGLHSSCRHVGDRYWAWPKRCCLALLSPALVMGAWSLLWVFK